MMEATRRTFSLDLPIANILQSPKRDWRAISFGKNRIAADRKIDVDWKEFTEDKYLFSHVSIVSSVNTTANGYYIEAPTDELVNNNGNAWTAPVLRACFKSFIGGNNFLEHVQDEALSKGTILDAVLRPVTYMGKNRKSAEVLYCDLLVATDRKHKDLVRDIESKKLSTLSMGCVASQVQCSHCGTVFGDDVPSCEHINNQLLTYFVDENGIRRITSELCGASHWNERLGQWEGIPDSCKFIEASWVENPAFRGAVVNHYISEVPKAASYVLDMPTQKLELFANDLFRMRVADRWGMLILRVACAEIIRRRQESLIDRVAGIR